MKPLPPLSDVRQDLWETLFDLQCDVLMLDAFLSYDVPCGDLAEYFCDRTYWDALGRWRTTFASMRRT